MATDPNKKPRKATGKKSKADKFIERKLDKTRKLTGKPKTRLA